jgi:methyltransferase
MNMVAFAVALVYGFMLAEQRVSMHNERWLRAQGAVEPTGDVYRAMAWLYPVAFLAMGIEGVWRAAGRAGELTDTGPAWAASGVVLFVASKALKYWAIRSLGPRWTFRVLVLPNAPLVTTGPYRYIRHPNYIAVVGEFVSAAMMVGAPISGLLMLITFGVALRARIRVEERALAASGAPGNVPAGPA